MTLLRELYYYPGRNLDHDYKAIRLQSALLTGMEWLPLINNLLMRLVLESNPKELEIFPYFNTDIVWSSINDISVKYSKIMPQMKEFYSVSSEDDIISTIKMIYTKIFISVSNHRMASKHTIYFLEWSGEISERVKQEITEYISYILENGSSVGVHLFLIGNCFDEFVPESTLRIVTNSNDSTKTKSGMCDVLDGDNKYNLYIPFIPNTLITKFMRFYSVNKKE